MGILGDALRWLTDPDNWSGTFGIANRLLEHVQLSALAVAIAAAVALPVGMFIGHSRRGELLAVSMANVGRALPSFAVLALVFPFTLRYLPGIGFWATLIAMVLLGIPPVLTNTYVGIQGVDADAVEAARGMGMRGRDVLLHLEIPLAAPLIMAGLRTAAVQVVATATLGAIVAWGGLGRFIIDGFAQGNLSMMVGGAILVALLAIVTELGLGLVERLVSPRTTSSGRRDARIRGSRPADAPGPVGAAH